MDEEKINEIIEAIVRQMNTIGGITANSLTQADALTNNIGKISPQSNQPKPQTEAISSQTPTQPNLSIDLPDPTDDVLRFQPHIKNPEEPEILKELINSTTARIGVGRAGPRYNTASLLLFQGDHAITQDALFREIDLKLLDEFGLFSVQTKITGGLEQFLLRPDLGRQLNEESKRIITEKCKRNPNVQLVIGDGLSTTAIEANIRQIFPVIKQGLQSENLSFGTPFFIKYCRVGVMNDIGDVINPDVLLLLIGERPGLGRAESMSVYMGYKPKKGDSDADRDVICNIFENGGTNPLEAGAFVVQIVKKMLKFQASGIKLKMATA